MMTQLALFYATISLRVHQWINNKLTGHLSKKADNSRSAAQEGKANTSRAYHSPALIALILAIIAVSMTRAQVSQKHELVIDESQNHLPKCHDHRSICGFMQINPVGVNKVSICACKDKVECPLWWNPLDPRTVRHGNDFYKYCSRQPDLVPCQPNEVAYTSYGKSDMLTGKKIVDIQKAHCICPNNYILRANKTSFDMSNSNFYVYTTEQLCQKPPQCSRRQHCLSVTQTVEGTLEKRHCRCPSGMYCPRDLRNAIERIQADKGILYNMRCISHIESGLISN